MSVGFSVQRRQRRVSAETVEAFRAVPVANVSDCMFRMFAGGAALRPIHDVKGVVGGPALTVRARPGDNLMLHHALDICEPGDFIVVDAGGDLTTAIMGEIMAAIALKKGVAGIAINGAIRDADEIRRMGLPLFACGITHRGPYKNGPGEINTPISLGGTVIEPGDLVLGDGDGLLSVAYDMTETVLAAAQKKHAAEQEEIAQIEAGTNNRSWVMKALRDGGCDIQ